MFALGARRQVDVSEFTVENAVHKSFDGIIRQQLDPMWHRVSARSKQLINDLKTLRKLLTYAHCPPTAAVNLTAVLTRAVR